LTNITDNKVQNFLTYSASHKGSGELTEELYGDAYAIELVSPQSNVSREWRTTRVCVQLQYLVDLHNMSSLPKTSARRKETVKAR